MSYIIKQTRHFTSGTIHHGERLYGRKCNITTEYTHCTYDDEGYAHNIEEWDNREAARAVIDNHLNAGIYELAHGELCSPDYRVYKI